MANNRIIIEAFKLEGFRAYLQEQVFNLVRNKIPHSLAIFAPNAKGKSSIVDAFEYYISEEATLNRLGKRAAQTKAGPIAMEHVEAQENGVDSSVHFWFKQGDDKFSDSRKVNVSLSTPPLTNAAKRILKYAKVPFIIRGFELRKFVDGVTPEKRYENIVKWFNLEPLFLIQKNLRQLRRQIKQKAEQNSELNERLIDLKHRTNNEIVTWDELKVCEWFNANVLFHLDKTLKLKTISESDETYQVLINRKEAEEKGIGLATLKQLISIIDGLCGVSIEGEDSKKGRIAVFDGAVEVYNKSITKMEEEKKKASNSVFNEVWSSAQKVLENTECELDACPVCETSFALGPHGSRDNVLVNLKKHLRALADYQKAENEYKVGLRNLETEMRELRSDLELTKETINNTEYSNTVGSLIIYLEALNGWKAGQKKPESCEVVDELVNLRSTVSRKKENIEKNQGDHTYVNALSKAKDFLRLKSDLNRIERTKTEMRLLNDELAIQALDLNKSIVEHTQALIGSLQSDINTLYKEIQGGEEDVPPIRLNLPKEDDKNQQRVDLLIDFAENRKGVVPGGYLSDSQVHTLALVIRLAAIRRFNPGFPVIVLDDVVTSYDADHRKTIASVLAKYFFDYQMIIVTHDEQFFLLLQDHLPRKSWMYRRIIKIEPKFGPKFHDHTIPDEIIESKLDNSDSAAEEIRQSEENWLLDICRSFRVKVEIRPVDKPYKYMRSELAEALAKYLKSKNMLPPEIPGIANAFLVSLQRGEVENFGIHFSDNPYKSGSIGDQKTRWQEFKNFRDKFVCSKCKKNKFKRPIGMDKPVCVKCETTFTFTHVEKILKEEVKESTI